MLKLLCEATAEDAEPEVHGWVLRLFHVGLFICCCLRLLLGLLLRILLEVEGHLALVLANLRVHSLGLEIGFVLLFIFLKLLSHRVVLLASIEVELSSLESHRRSCCLAELFRDVKDLELVLLGQERVHLLTHIGVIVTRCDIERLTLE